jgi:hypothetical protein
MPTTPHRALEPTADPERNGDEKPPTQTQSTTVEFGSMGLSGIAKVVGNLSAMAALIVLLFIKDARNEKLVDRNIELTDKVNTTSEKNVGVFESHLATNIVEFRETRETMRSEGRETRDSLKGLAVSTDKNTQALERLIWATGVAGGWPFGVPKKEKE